MRITVVQGDVTRQQTDAIVNAANSSLLGGGGVDGAIHRHGGPEILAACRRLRAEAYPDGLPTGQAVATTAGLLPATWVIHTVGPVYSSREDRSALLASCYTESLRVAAELGARTVAFPAVSAGVYGWPGRVRAPASQADPPPASWPAASPYRSGSAKRAKARRLARLSPRLARQAHSRRMEEAKPSSSAVSKFSSE
jgi:O-acetyl-ADP-ribose deacetylase